MDVLEMMVNKIKARMYPLDSACSAEWLYEKGYRTALLDVLGDVERLQQKKEKTEV